MLTKLNLTSTPQTARYFSAIRGLGQLGSLTL